MDSLLDKGLRAEILQTCPITVAFANGELTVNGQSNQLVFHIPMCPSPSDPASAVFPSKRYFS
jgi:hypothetical protein